MKEIECDKKHRKHVFLKILGVGVLVLFVLVSIAGAVPFAYVVDGHFSDNPGEGRISVIDTAINKVIAKVPGYFYGPGIAVNPAGTKVYVIKSSDNVSVVDTNTNTVTATIPVQHGANGVAVNPEGTKTYVTSDNWMNSENFHSESTGAKLALIKGTKERVMASKGIVSVIDTETNTVTAIIPLGSGARGVIVNPNGKKVYVTTPSNNNVSVIDTATNKVTAMVPVGSYPEGVAINSDGTKVYVANGGSDTVSVIDTATNTVTATIPVESGPYGVAVTPDGKKAYVTNSGSNNVSVIDTSTNKVTATMNVGRGPNSFGQFIGSFQAQPIFPVANFTANVTSGYAPLTVQFTDLSENIVSNSWDFNNDGIADSAEINPVYEFIAQGNYTVNLTVNNENGTNSKLATINVLTKSSSSGGSSGSSHKSGGSGGDSPEPARNVQVKELSQAFITSGKPVKFDFTKNATCVVYINFDSKRTFGKTTTITEQLKGKSALVSGLSEGEVYKFFNVWVGNGGIATSKNIENPVVCFKVEKAWINDKKINPDSITLNRYSDKKWEQSPVNLSGKDDKFLYFIAETSGFSSFAITGTTKQPEENITEVQIYYPETINDKAGKGSQNEQKEIPSISGFEVYYGVAGLLAILLYKKW